LLAFDRDRIAFDDTGGKAPRALALPGTGGVRSADQLLPSLLRPAGYGVVTMDARGVGVTVGFRVPDRQTLLNRTGSPTHSGLPF